MIKFLLHLFPRSFVERMGDDWIADTRSEWSQARSVGWLAMIACMARTFRGCLEGASISHIHAIKVSLSTPRREPHFVTIGHHRVLLGPDQPPAPKFMYSPSLLGLFGILLAGHLSFGLFLVLWVNEGFDTIPAQILTILKNKDQPLWVLLAFSPLLVKFVGVFVGLYLAISCRIKSSIPLLSVIHLCALGLAFFMAFSASRVNWILIDMGKYASAAVETFIDYPLVRKQMGLSDVSIYDVSTPVQCERAISAFSAANARWVRHAQKTGDLNGLVLLKFLARSLYSHGCWNRNQLVEANQDLIKSSVLDRATQRRIALHFPSVKEGVDIVLEKIPFTRADLCFVEAQRMAVGQLDETQVFNFCSKIPFAQKSIHTHKPFMLSKDSIEQIKLSSKVLPKT